MANEIEGLDEVMRMFKEVGKVSQKVITKAAKSGAKIVRDDAKREAPVDTGDLKRGIIMKAEKRKRGKKVYDIKFSNNPNFIKYGVNGKRYFYPAAVEYGWVSKNGKIVPGYAFLRNAHKNNDRRVKRMIIDKLKKGLEEVRGNGV
jgi:HK97 gp10 family phage protein